MKNYFSQFLDAVMENANFNIDDFYVLESRYYEDARIIGVNGFINPNISVRYDDDPRIVFSVDCIVYRGFDYSPKCADVEAAGSMAALIIRETDNGSALFKSETVEVIFEPLSASAAETMQMYERFLHSWTEVAREWKTSHSSELGIFGC